MGMEYGVSGLSCGWGPGRAGDGGQVDGGRVRTADGGQVSFLGGEDGGHVRFFNFFE
jgi:hypothetical protein